MKLTTLLLIITLTQVSAKVFSQKITLNEKNAPLEKVLESIKKQSGYLLFYQDQDIQKAYPVNIKENSATLQQTLDDCFADQPLSYKILDKTIIVEKKEPNLIDKSKAFFAQVTISGKVTDEIGVPLLGVTVRIKDTNIATATDSKGSYSLVVPDNKTIISFSFIGFETQELAAKDIPTGSVIKLKATETNLKEVVVNKGYYNTTKALNTGNVSSVSAKEIEEQPVTNVLSALEGRVPGLYVQQNSGVAGAAITVRLRGQNSIANGNDPLYIVDGVPFTSTTLVTVGNSTTIVNNASPLNYLNPSDIENIDVLKDADATAIYGSRGANGVILITTKKGKAGKTNATFNVYQGAGEVSHMMSLLNTQQYLQMRHEAFKNDGVALTPSTPNANDLYKWDTTRYTNWQKVLIGGVAHQTDVQGNISGGNENTQFLFGGGYHRESSVFPGDYADQRSSVHFSLTHSSTDQKFKAILSASYIADNNNLPGTDLTALAIKLAPDAPALYNADGTLNWASSTWTNPLSYTVQPYQATTKNLISNGVFSYNIFKGLQIKTSLGYTSTRMDETAIFPVSSFNPANNVVANSKFGNSNLTTWIIEPQLQYQNVFGMNKIDIIVGSSFQENTFNSLSLSATGFSNDAQLTNIQAATSITAGTNTITDYRYNALYGRFNYNYDDRYILNLTARRDGSSRFGPGKQFGNFGAIGVAWLFTNEKLVKENITWLSYGKLRASYGTSGNDQIKDYKYLSTYSATGYSYGGSTLYPTGLTNPNYGWEVNKKLEVGLELGFLKDHILLSGSYYRNRSGNELVGYALAPTTGYTSITANLPAVVQNTGIELTLNTVNINNRDFSWKSSINFTIPQNKLISYPNLAGSSYATTYIIDQSLFIRKTLNYQGVNPQTGVYQFQDVDGDGNISSPQDRQTIEQPTQKYYGGLQNSLIYKGFQLDFLFQFVKQTALNYLSSYSTPGVFSSNGQFGNEPAIVLSRWQNPGDITNVQKFTQTTGAAYTAYSNSSNYGSNTISDASFIKLKNLSLSYKIRPNWLQHLKVQDCRVFLQGQNLFTITKYLGLDPETQSFFALPTLRMLTAGFQLTL